MREQRRRLSTAAPGHADTIHSRVLDGLTGEQVAALTAVIEPDAPAATTQTWAFRVVVA